MKKVQIVLASGSRGADFFLFGSAEAAYVWATTLSGGEEPQVFRLGEGDLMEAEWMGCEYAHEDGVSLRLDQVRLAFGQRPRNAAGLMVSLHEGWSVQGGIPFRDHADDEISVTRIGASGSILAAVSSALTGAR